VKSIRSRLGIVGILIATQSCGTLSPSESTVPSGTWGGDHVLMTVSAAGASAEFDCAHGTIDGPLALDSSQRFDVAGTFVQEHGGPIRVDETIAAVPARYSGTSRHGTMTLTITLTSGGQSLGPFELTFGQQGRVFKCL
jgi:hypothetical protein